jgi:PadR family transcriptional regulator PadR
MQKDFRTAWLLLLLRDGSSYGYELRRELGVQALELNAAVMYRSLRGMEQSGLIASRWVQSGAGPARRMYDITDAGQAELKRIAVTVGTARDAHSAFLAAYEDSCADTA